jgi:hypothetical protein
LVAPIAWKYKDYPNSPYFKVINPPPIPSTIQWTSASMGGAVSVLLSLIATLSETFYVPRTKKNMSILFKRALIQFIMFILCAGPIIAVFVLYFQLGYSSSSKAVNGLTVASIVLNFVSFFVVCAVAPSDYIHAKVISFLIFFIFLIMPF